jgi:large subunit ribosomal protein L9
MKIILLQDVAKLGKRFDIKEVSDGHATNFLIPRKLAISGTAEAVKRIESQKMKLAGDKKIHQELLAQNIDSLAGATLRISGKANEKGHLFAGLHKEEIIKELQKQTRVQLDPEFLLLDQPIKEVGEHIIDVKGGGKTGKLKLVVEAKK